MSTPDSPPSRKASKSPSKLTKWLLLALFFLGLALFGLLYIGDVAPPQDEDFLYQYTEVGAQPDLFKKLSDLGKEIEAVEREESELADAFERASSDPESSEALLRGYSDILNRLEATLSSGELISVPVKQFTDPVSNLVGIDSLARILGFRAENSARLGEYAKASDDYSRIFRISHSLAGQNVILIRYVVALRAQELGLKSIARSLKKSAWPAEDALRLKGRIESQLLGPGHVIDALSSEYTMARNTIQAGSINSGLSGVNGIFYKPNKTHAFLFHFFKESVKDVNRSPEKRTTGKITAEFIESTKGWKFYLSDNRSGQQIIASLLPTLGAILQSSEEGTFRGEALCVLVALYAYSRDKGSLPNELSELVPSYMEKLPVRNSGESTVKYDAVLGQLKPEHLSDSNLIIKIEFPHLLQATSEGK